MRRLRNRPSPSMVVALLALFVSLGGVSYGVATGSIDGRELKNDTVRSRDLRNNDVRGKDLRRGTVASSDLKNDAVTGADILESSLGAVNRAASADRATSAGAADDAQAAGRLAGLSPASVNGPRRQMAPLPATLGLSD
jgi:hypothetical protein